MIEFARKYTKLHHVAATVVVLLFVFIGWNFATQQVHADTTGTNGRILLTIYDGGSEKGIITDAKTLRDALAKAGIVLDSHDVTEPSLDSELVATQYKVNIYRARPVIIDDNGKLTRVMTPYRTAKQVTVQAGVTLHDEDTAKFIQNIDLSQGAAETMVITRATEFTFVYYGKTITSYSQAKTVSDMLQSKGISLGTNDQVSVDGSTALSNGMTVRLWRNGKQTLTQDEDVAYTTQTIKDANRDIGYSETRTAGVNGKRTATYEILIQDGVEVSRKEISSVSTKDAVQEVKVVGTKVNLPAGSHEDWMAAAGIAESDYGYVNYIVGRESGWGVTKSNYAGSGAYGLCQSLPGSKMASAGSDWATNPITQLRWCNSYAVSRYGSWAGAYSFWLSHHWW